MKSIKIFNQFHSFLIFFMKRIARVTDGTSEYITGSQTMVRDVLDIKLVKQLELATLPSLNDVRIDWGELGPAPPPPDASDDDEESLKMPPVRVPSARCPSNHKLRHGVRSDGPWASGWICDSW